jgi:hypothetical protein
MTQFIPAKANKGLMIGVIPKYVEGYSIRYVTGSGQKKSTQDRVHVYEVEGHVKAVQRNTMRKHHSSDHSATKARKPSGPSSAKSGSKKKFMNDEDSEVSPRPSKRNRSFESYGSWDSTVPRPYGATRGASLGNGAAPAVSSIDLDLVSESDDYTDSYHSSNDDSHGKDPALDDRDDVTSELSEDPLDVDLDELDSIVLEKPPLLRNFTWGTDANRIGGGYRAAEDDLLLVSVPDHKSLAFSGSSLLPPDLLLSQTILV